MTRARLGLAVFLSTGIVLAACATASLPPDSFTGGDAAPDVATTGDAASCPQFDLQTDPKHCGSCTKACAAAEVCSLGACKNACDPPTIKCSGSQSCSDLTKDPKNCGQCGTACSSPDAGPDTGNGNPDSGLPPPDGGFDAGAGWTFGSPGCDAGKCDLACAAGTSLCQDSLCWDTQNAHDHCGGCSTTCAADVEWCTKGHCCSTGTDYCNGACADLLSDPNNCGACGTKCGVSTPVCSSGVCSTAISYSQAIPSGVLSTGSTQCVAWHTFLSQLTGTYTSITLKGSNDLVGRTCTGAVANQLCQSLHSASVNPSAPTYVASVACNGHNWSTGNCAVTGKEISLDIDVAACQCPNPGYVARPCIGNENWGGVNTNTCSSPNPPAQTITVECK